MTPKTPDLPETPDEGVQCSAKACRAEARHVLVWNNPKVHTPDREKTWVACDAHRTSLSEHLDVRGFLKRVEPLAGADDEGRVTCTDCGAGFPAGQDACPVCAGVRSGSCGGRE